MTRHARRTVHLCCGSYLYFAADVPPPEVGTLIACARHGYCAVVATGRRADDESVAPGRIDGRQSRVPRSQQDLREFLVQHPNVTLGTLRRHRFTLRRVAAAEQAGELSIDWDAGVVRSMRP